MVRDKLACSIILLVIACLAGCAGYQDDSRRTIGEFTDDAGIQAGVKTALIRDPEVNGLAINVEVRRGIVSLFGRVPSDHARQKAVGVASRVRGVVRVEDRLTLP